MNIDLNDLIKWLEFKKSINSEDLKNIQWLKDGKPVYVPPEAIDEWKYVGLSNIEFAVGSLIEEKK